MSYKDGDSSKVYVPSSPWMKVVVVIFLVLVVVASAGATLFLPTILSNILSHLHPHWEEEEIIGKASTYKSFLDGLTAVVGFLSMPTIGGLSDVFGRKKIMIVCTIGSVLYMATLFAAYHFSSLGLLYISCIFSFSGGSQVCVIAYMSDTSADEREKGRNFGIVLSCYIVGTIVGSLLPGLIGGFGIAVVCSIFVCLSAAGLFVLSFFFKENTDIYTNRKYKISTGNPLHCLRILFTISPYVTGVVISHFLFTFSITAQTSTGVLYALHRYNWGTRQYGILIAIGAGASMLWQTAGMAVLQKRFSQENMLVAALLVGFVLQFCQGIISNGWIMLALGTLGGYVAVAFPLLQVLPIKKIPSEKQGISFGGLGSIGSIATLLGSLVYENLFGLCLKGNGYFTCPGTPFYLASLLFIVNAIMCIILFQKTKAYERDMPLLQLDEHEGSVNVDVD